jgi:DNA-directed RNA polymerase subunit RPC12/RpoP
MQKAFTTDTKGAIMICPDCNKEKINIFDKFSIEKRDRCVDCHNRFMAKPENNPDYKTFSVEARGYASFEVRALDEDDAQDKAGEQVYDEASWDFDIKEQS